jgi:hypothetical protein
MACIPAIMSFSRNGTRRALLCSTDPSRFFPGCRPVRLGTFLYAISMRLFMIEPSRLLTIGLSSVKAALDPILLIQLLFNELCTGLTIGQTTRKHDCPTDCDEHAFHQSLLDRHIVQEYLDVSAYAAVLHDLVYQAR